MTTQQFLLSAWAWSPWLLGISAAALAVYRVLWPAATLHRMGFLAVGLAVLWLTLASPIDALANGYLFSAHMLQHLLLLLVVPAAVWLSLPPLAMRPDPLSRRQDETTKHRWWRSLFPWLCGTGGMWLWHAPALCNAAVTSPWVHRAQYVSLVVMGGVFWLPILGPRMNRRLPPLLGIIYLFTACLSCTLLGVFLTFSPVEVCSIYLHPVDRLGIAPLIQNSWGLTPATDQQVGGLLMWAPACLIYLGAILGLLARWYREPEAVATESPTASSANQSAGAGMLMEKYHA